MSFPIGTSDGLFHDGNPATNTPGTIIPADWLNAVQAAVLNFSGTVKEVSGTYPILSTDGVIFGNTSNVGFTVTLPAIASVAAGKRFWLKNVGTGNNTLSIVAADSKTIDGQLQIDIMQGEKISVVPRAGNWETI